MPATFVISLDFELYWGVRDVCSIDDYRENLLGERIAVEALLELFHRRGVRATWATVGALFCGSRRELLASLPERLPNYVERKLAPFDDIDQLGEDERSDPFHYAKSLVGKIARAPGQELATHTFGHYYCLEPGQSAAEFSSDLSAAVRIAAPYTPLRSIVFPRNQYNPRYRDVLASHGIRAFRSTGSHWAWKSAVKREPRRKGAIRFADAYLPISGPHSHALLHSRDGLCDVPASAFLRPYRPSLRHLERLRFQRIASALDGAARRQECYHLWWHPHNFGTHLHENMRFLEAILDRFDAHRRRGRMESSTMGEASEASAREDAS